MNAIKRINWRLRKGWLLAAALFAVFGPFNTLSAVAPPSPAEKLLIIYTDTDAYQISLMQAFTTALGAIVPAPTIDLVVVHTADGLGPGFYDELVAQQAKTDLFSWCQVYDLRFRDDKGNLNNAVQSDAITLAGANNDGQLFTDFLNIGGSLFLQGEQHDFYSRNYPLLNFINSVATSPITQAIPNALPPPVTINTFSCAVLNFCNNFNNLAAAPGNFLGNWPGGIDLAQCGSGQPIITQPTLGAVMMAYLSNNLNTAGGKMVVSWESNGFCEAAYRTATSDWVIQNVYALLSGCQHLTVTKSFTPPNVCVGDAGSFQICTYNIGPNVLTNASVYDTIPTCLSFQSSAPVPSSSASNYYQWTIPSIAVGVTSCVTVSFNTVLYPPCP